jgi:hypothetical protein
LVCSDDWVIEGVLHKDVLSVWPQVEPLLNKALLRRHGEYTSEDILGFLRSRDMQLWTASDGVIRAAAISQIISYPQLKVCLFTHLGGSGLRFWKAAQPLIESWARSQGCQALRAGGRRGWARVFGMQEVYTVAEKRL